MYDILIQNNSSKEIFLLSGQTPSEETGYYLVFKNLDLSPEIKGGEYTYAIIKNDRDDVEYTFETVLLQTIISIKDTDLKFTLEQLNPFTGLLRIETGEPQPEPIFTKDDTQNNNTVYYYEG